MGHEFSERCCSHNAARASNAAVRVFIWLAIAAILWRMGAKYLREPVAKGEIFSMYLVLTGIARFLIEFIRINPRSFFGMSNAQTASLVSIALGVALLLRLKSQSGTLRKIAAA